MKHYALMKHTDYVDVGIQNCQSDAELCAIGLHGDPQTKKDQGIPWSSDYEHPQEESSFLGRAKGIGRLSPAVPVLATVDES